MAHPGRSHIAELHGIGGRLTLHRDRIVLERRGVLFNTVNLAFHLEREMETEILLRELGAIHFVRSLLLVQFLRFTYAGCPSPTGHYLRDAFAENAYLFSLSDNRPLTGLMHKIAHAAAAVGAQPELPR